MGAGALQAHAGVVLAVGHVHDPGGMMADWKQQSFDLANPPFLPALSLAVWPPASTRPLLLLLPFASAQAARLKPLDRLRLCQAFSSLLL